jgi:hypothetical protein
VHGLASIRSINRRMIAAVLDRSRLACRSMIVRCRRVIRKATRSV